MATKLIVGANDLATTHPALCKEWSKDRNLPLTAKNLTAGSGKSVWWNCKKNHYWEASPATRTKGFGCPYCSNQRALFGYNDLETRFPKVAAEWSYKLNARITPRNVVPGSNKKFWWTCPEGHDFESKVSSRTVRGTGCPYCSNQSLLKGFNDLQTTHPDLAKQWSKSKNSNMKPSEVIAGTNYKYWWECSLGHEWLQSANVRSGGSGCPVCAHQQLWPGFNDLATTKPQLASQWNSEKNGIEPSEVMAGAKFLAWWKCDQGHEWQSQLRGRKEGNCSICLNRALLQGFNDLETKSPELSRQWHTKKNGSLKPSQVLFNGRTKKHWWRCDEGHEWEATLASRHTGNNCPICSRQLVAPGVNDMATTNPDLALSFDLKKNYPTRPENVLAGTAKAFWWKCEKGHSWKAVSNSRFYGRGCPTCAEYGFKPELPAVFYFIENISLSARKIGITNVERNNTRLGGFFKQGWKEILIFEHEDGKHIQEIEKEVLKWIRTDKGMPIYLTSKEMGRQGGWTETFSLEGPSNKEILNRIQVARKRRGSS